MFIGRERELEQLNKMYASDHFEFAVIYGRRRVGKTTLINEFCKDKKSIYYMSSESTQKVNLESLSQAVFDVLIPDVPVPAFDSFYKLLDFLDGYLNERIILAIDEYPYLAESDRSISSILQTRIDQKWKNSKIMLILCGSSMSFMEYQVLGYKSPLYGRRTAQFKLKPFTYFETQKFAPEYSPEEQAVLYGVSGGVPEYLNRFSMEKTLEENIISLFFTRSGMLFEEPVNLLKQELRNFAIYNAVIKAVATGASRLNEIATKVGEDTAACSNQLNSLIALGLIRKEVPCTENETSRKTLYRIEDNMFQFWYRFVAPNISSIERDMGELVFRNKVVPHLNDFMGAVFEEICMEYMYLPPVIASAPFFYGNLSRWWGNNPKKKRQEEIDLMAIEGDCVLLGECKWISEPSGISILNTLIERGRLFPQKHKWYYLFSKNGFTDAVVEEAKNDRHIRLFSFTDMMHIF